MACTIELTISIYFLHHQTDFSIEKDRNHGHTVVYLMAVYVKNILTVNKLSEFRCQFRCPLFGKLLYYSQYLPYKVNMFTT